MNIKEMFRKKVKSHNKTHEIVTYNSLVSIPDRKYFKGDQGKLDLIDSYKLLYTHELASREYLTSRDFSDEGLIKEISVNTDMLVHLIMKVSNKQQMMGRNDTELTPSEEEERIIFNYKLELYMERLNQLELDTILRLIALNEIRREKPFLSPVKRRAIGTFHDILMKDVFLLVSQRDAINKEINNNFIMLYNAIYNNDDREEVDSDFLTNRLTELANIGKSIGNDKIMAILKNNERLELKIARIERELEIYAHNNEEEKKKLAELIDELNLKMDSAYVNKGLCSEDKGLCSEDKGELLKRISVIRAKYKIFYEFGRNIVTDEELFNLYRLIFNFYTIDLLDIDYSIFKENNSKEFECYKEIVMKKIEKIVRGENSNIEAIFGKNSKKAIKVIINMFKNGEKQFDHAKILNDKLLLTFLLSLDTNRVNGFYEFINEFVMGFYSRDSECTPIWEDSIPRKDLIPGKVIFDWNMPLATILWLMDSYYKVRDTDEAKKYIYGAWEDLQFVPSDSLFGFIHYIARQEKFDKLYELDMLRMKAPDHYCYQMPEGIVEIDSDAYDVNAADKKLTANILWKISTGSQNRVLMFPKSLRVVKGDFLKGSSAHDIVVNHGIREIISYPFCADRLVYPREIVLPDSVENFTSKDYKLSAITFDNFKNSKMLHNKEAFAKILEYASFVNGYFHFEDNDEIYSIKLNDERFSWHQELKSLHSEPEESIVSFAIKTKLATLDNDEILAELVNIIEEETGYRIEFRDENTYESDSQDFKPIKKTKHR